MATLAPFTPGNYPLPFGLERSTTSEREGDVPSGARGLTIATPTSTVSLPFSCLASFTPQPSRDSLNLIAGNVVAIFFDFDGTLTALPGERAPRRHKQEDLHNRAALLKPRLCTLREAGIRLFIISKSSEHTISTALDGAGLRELFDDPLFPGAVGFEGKAGLISDFVREGGLGDLSENLLHHVMLVDDDIRELERARACGLQTYPAPAEGGLQNSDFDVIFSILGLQTPEDLCGSLASCQNPFSSDSYLQS